MNAIDFLQTIAIVFSILMGVWQIRSQTLESRLSRNNKLYEDFNEINLLGFSNPNMMREFEEPYDPKTAKFTQAFWLMGYIHTKMDQIFEQYHKFGTLSKADWETLSPVYLFWLQTKFGRGWWDSRSQESHDEEFSKYYEQMLSDQ